MGFDVSETARRLWDEWNLRGAVLCSLFFQVVLIILANKRKETRGGVIGAIIWSAYLLADWFAIFTIGLISSGDCLRLRTEEQVNKQLAAFWAPFLLLHLGGPDAITAFSLEDNELWIRHLTGFVIQVVGVAYVFLMSLSEENEYRIPTVLVFFVGVCKYAERSLSLYKSCLGNFKRSLLPEPDPGPNYAQLMEDLTELESSHVPVTIKVEKGTDSSELTSSKHQPFNHKHPDLTIVHEGHRFFKKFKGLVVDLMFSFEERNESRNFFFASKAADAFRVMEVELNFLYDVLHTKAPILHCGYGCLCRFLCTALLVACFQQFAVLPHHNIFHFDEIITYVLLVSAVVLDVVGAFNLVLSDWALDSAGVASQVLIRLRSWRGKRQRWSNMMGQHSFISLCLKEDGRFIRWLKKVAHRFGVEESLNEFLYTKEKLCEEMLKKFVFGELKEKASKAESIKDAKEIYSARGGYVLCDYPIHYSHSSIEASLSDEAEYDESLLMWHIATELCYFTNSPEKTQNDDHTANGTNQDGGTKKDDGTEQDHHTANGAKQDDVTKQDGVTTKDRIKICKLLSDYMLYLLVMRPTLMSTVAGIAQIRFQDTCKEANVFFNRLQSESKSMSPEEKAARPPLTPRKACEMLLDVKTKWKPKDVKGDRSKSVLFDACILAKDLRVLSEDRRWEMMSRIWVELLSYAATRCRPSDHARQLTQGGEFITFVWLIMVHFGLAEQFRIERDVRAKLRVGQKKS